MDFLIELILDLILEGSIELSQSKKVPTWIRYILITIIILFFSIVIIGIFILGIMISNETIFGGLLLIILSMIFVILGISKFKKIYLEKKRINYDFKC